MEHQKIYYFFPVKIVFHLVNALRFENIFKRTMFARTHTNTHLGRAIFFWVSDNGSHFTGRACHSQVNKLYWSENLWFIDLFSVPAGKKKIVLVIIKSIVWSCEITSFSLFFLFVSFPPPSCTMAIVFRIHDLKQTPQHYILFVFRNNNKFTSYDCAGPARV